MEEARSCCRGDRFRQGDGYVSCEVACKAIGSPGAEEAGEEDYKTVEITRSYKSAATGRPPTTLRLPLESCDNICMQHQDIQENDHPGVA